MKKLERIVTNLLSNCGEVHRRKRADMSVTLHAAGPDGTEITVANTGARIPDAQLSRVFDRFYQADQPTGYHEGTGIGLALVKELVSLQGGTVSVKSGADGFDTVFHSSFPYRRGGAQHSTENVIQKINGNGHIRHEEAYLPKILLVEDNAGWPGLFPTVWPKITGSIMRRMVRRGLQWPPEMMLDLIISDVMMPVMDGYTFCKLIKSNLETSHIPVVLLTAKSALKAGWKGWNSARTITLPAFSPA